MPISTFIVDDQEDIRLLLRVVISADSDLELAGEATNGTEALAQLATTDPQVVVVDQMMPGMSGLDVVREVRQHGVHQPRFILCSAHLDAQVLDEAAKAGVDRCVSKFDVVRIGDVIREAASCA